MRENVIKLRSTRGMHVFGWDPRLLEYVVELRGCLTDFRDKIEKNRIAAEGKDVDGSSGNSCCHVSLC